eukprot:5119141-Amphidinium_carterae.1
MASTTKSTYYDLGNSALSEVDYGQRHKTESQRVREWNNRPKKERVPSGQVLLSLGVDRYFCRRDRSVRLLGAGCESA